MGWSLNNLSESGSLCPLPGNTEKSNLHASRAPWVKPVRRWEMAFSMDAKPFCEFLGPVDVRVMHDFASFC